MRSARALAASAKTCQIRRWFAPNGATSCLVNGPVTGSLFGVQGEGGGIATMRLLLRFMGFLFTAGTIVFLVGVAGVAGLLWHYSKDLPDYSQLQDYEPAGVTSG